jgi:hypothetical protein
VSSIERAPLEDDTVCRAAATSGEGSRVTREEKEQAVDAVLSTYAHLGATLVADDQTLVRLLQTLELSTTDREVGDYLCSFLIA